MKVKDVMTRGIEMVHAGTTVKQAAMIMRDCNIGVLPVMNSHDISGIFSDRDITIRSTAMGEDPSHITVDKIMNKKVECCSEDDDLKIAIDKMENHKIRRLVVLDQQKHVTGMLSLGDLATHSAQQQACEVLEKVSEPENK
jgi:CBS domain-containing protein